MAGAALLAASLQSVTAQSIGVNFVNSSGGGVDNGNADSLLASETAGAPAYAQTNWNNLSKWGSGVTLNDSTGAATALFINWDAGWNGSSGTAAALGTPDGKLMDGYLGGNTSIDTLGTSVYGSAWNAKPMVYLSGLSAWCLAHGAIGYTVVMYRCDGGGSWETTHGYVQSVTGNPSANNMVGGADLTPRLYIAQNSTFSGTYKQISTNATSSGTRDASGGNYCVFSGLTNDAVLIRTGGDQSYWGNGAMNGFQIVPAFPTALSVGIPAASVANPVAQGTTDTLSASVNGGTPPYKYQWQTDGGSGGTLTNIPSKTNATFSVNTTGMIPGVNFSYSLVVTDSVLATATSAPAVVNVIQVLPGTLAGTANVAPTPGAYDISQLAEAGGYQSSDGLNYYTDNGQNNNKYCGQTFTTGSNAQGYTLNSLAIGLEGGSQGSQAANTTYDLFIYQISTDGQTANVIADVTNLMASTLAYPNWAQWNFSGIILTNNAVYGYGFGRRSVGGYIGIATSPGWYDAYSGGQIAAFPRNGGAVIYGNAGYGDTSHDGVFDIGLIPNGVAIILNVPSAAPNPAYALTPVKLADTVAVAGSATTYKWLTDDGSGGYNIVPGATSTNLTVIPPDVNPGGADYTTNYYFVATDVLGNSATSSVVALTIHAATVPLITGPTPTNVITFVGDSRSFTVTENGTLPITNQWQFNNGGGYVSLTAQTNTTLALSNLQTTNSGNYQVLAANVVGSASNAVTLTVLPAPAAPVAATQLYFDTVYTNHPWAYWRLNETNDPTAVGAPTYTAYDYSGHGFDPVYGNAVTVGNAGPQPLTYPNMDTNELAVQTAAYTANAYLTPPALNLAGNSNVTFMAWINPNGSQANYTGLLMNRGGPDDGCGFGFIGVTDHLGYTWNNNSSATWSWDSTLAVADGQWNFVAYVITPTNAVVYLGNLNGGTTNFLQATHNINHIAQTFAGGTMRLGGDPSSLNNTFNGLITEATLFTNALSSAQVQQYFLVGIGAEALAPTVPNIAVSPADAAGAGVYSGQNVRLSSTPTGTAPLSLQWQAGPDGSTWTNVPDATNSELLINPFMVGTIYYQLSVTNAAGAGSTTPAAITFNALPAYPPSLWTVNFQETNNIGAGQTAGGGVGHYVGRGILGDGTYWNVLPHILAAGSEYSSGTINSVSDLMDDGVTSSGISCRMNNGGSYNSLGTSLPNSSDVGNLLDQFYRTYYSPNALQFLGVPDGTYNLTCYAGNGVSSQGANNYGSTFVVHDSANGNQTNSTAEATHTTDALSEGVNFVTFTNVHVAGGTLNVDVFGNADTGGSAIIEGAQIQLVSYDPPVAAFTGTPTNGTPPLTVNFANNSTGSTNWLWSFGDGNTFSTTGKTNVSHAYAAAGSYTVSLTAIGALASNSTTNTAYITVTAATPPVIGNVGMSGGSLVLGGSGGTSGQQYRILTSINVALPLASWTPVWTNVFAPDGSYSYTNASPTSGAGFFIIVTP